MTAPRSLGTAGARRSRSRIVNTLHLDSILPGSHSPTCFDYALFRRFVAVLKALLTSCLRPHGETSCSYDAKEFCRRSQRHIEDMLYIEPNLFSYSNL